MRLVFVPLASFTRPAVSPLFVTTLLTPVHGELPVEVLPNSGATNFFAPCGTSNSMRQSIVMITAAILLSSVACVEKAKQGSSIDPKYIESHLLSEVPADLDTSVNAELGGKVIYVGNKVDTKVLAPGGAGRVIHYWKVIEPPGAEWMFFTHLKGDGGQWMNLDATDMRTGYPTSKWKAGDIIADEQKFTLDANWHGTVANMTVGLYRKGGTGVGDRLPITSGPKDGESGVPVYRFKTEGKALTKAKDVLYAMRKADTPIVVDGKADEPAWKIAPKSPNFTDTEGGRAVDGKTTARLLWDDQFLYAFIEVSDKDVFSQFANQDDTLWKEDVVELFIDADRNRRGYIELQVNPNNAHFDAWFPTNRGGKSHFEWTSKMQSAVVVHGTNDKRDDTDQGWDVEIAIPIQDVKGMDSAMKVNVPPQLGDRWRLNVVRIDKPKGASAGASSWNPITMQDYHALGRMLTVAFADSAGMYEPAPQEGGSTPSPVAPAKNDKEGTAAQAEQAVRAPAFPLKKVHRQPLRRQMPSNPAPKDEKATP